MLFDLARDTYELHDESANPAYQPIRQELAARLEALKGLTIISPGPLRGTIGHSFAFQLAAWGGRNPTRGLW